MHNKFKTGLGLFMIQIMLVGFPKGIWETGWETGWEKGWG
jgi:hypothetical protein